VEKQEEINKEKRNEEEKYKQINKGIKKRRFELK
jgi:hypothetical protein